MNESGWQRFKLRIGHNPWFFTAPTFVLSFLVIVAPMIYMIFLSFHQVILTKPALGSPFVGLANYIELLHDPYFWTSLRITFVFTFGSVFVELLWGLGMALLLNREFKGKGIIRSLYLLPMMMTPVAAALAWKFMYEPTFGIINYYLRIVRLPEPNWLAEPSTALLAVMVTDIWRTTPFIFLVLLAALQALPRQVYEASKVDGASGSQQFLYITLPLLRPVILVISLIRLMDAFRMFDIIFVQTRGGPSFSTELAMVYNYRIGFRYFRIGSAGAFSTITLIVILVLCWFFIRALRVEVEI